MKKLILLILLLVGFSARGQFTGVTASQIGTFPQDKLRTYFPYPSSIPLAFPLWREGSKIGENYFTTYDWDSLKNAIPSTNSYYVRASTGNDANAGTIGSPLKSVKAALAKSDRDIIYIYPETYLQPDGWVFQNLSAVARPIS